MKFFLDRIAKELHSEFGDDLSSHCLVFPSRRAGLFFRKYYSALLRKPAWAPSVLTIGDLFRSLSDLRQAESEELLFELYLSYLSVTQSKENFDSFYFWGDMILNDFDDVDKYMAVPRRLFSNVKELKTIDQQFGDLTDEQIDAIRQFWIRFNPDAMTDAKSGFITVWNVLEKLYTDFRTRLMESGRAYEGMIYRSVAENNSWNDRSLFRWKMIHFIGLNALNECEKRMMLALKKEGIARFYWDYDDSYIKINELNSAGYFLKDNLSLLGNNMPSDWSYKTNISEGAVKVSYRIIDTASDQAQVRLVPGILKNLPTFNPGQAHETAVILADEDLLLPLMSGINDIGSDVNITMGFPVRHTLVGSFIDKLTLLQTNIRITDDQTLFFTQDVTDLILHPLFVVRGDINLSGLVSKILKNRSAWLTESIINELLPSQNIFRRMDTCAQLSSWFREVLTSITESVPDLNSGNLTTGKDVLNESVYRVILSINRLDSALAGTGLEISRGAWMKVLARLLKSQKVPFSGEPLSGLQIMGILESRALDFRNLIVLSADETNLPSAKGASSFIPFSLREAFGLPSINHRESIFAYHFYRLLHRVENVTFIYNSSSEGIRSGEMSRFLQQIKYNNKLKKEFLTSEYSILNSSEISSVVERKEEHNQQLLKRLTSDHGKVKISATAINMWLNCRMKFYYRYVCGLEEPADIAEELDPALLGTLLHEAMRHLYYEHRGKEVDAGLIDTLVSSETLINKSLDAAFDSSRIGMSTLPVTGYELLLRQVLLKLIDRVLRIDRAWTPFIIEGLEVPFGFKLAEINGIELYASGRIDRIDSRRGHKRIVDYKTGEVAVSVTSISSLFEDNRDKELDAWLQTMFYTEGFFSSGNSSKLLPAVYMLKKPASPETECRLMIRQPRESGYPVDDYLKVRAEFIEGLTTVLKKIFSSNEPFIMTDSLWSKCIYCPYKRLCLR